ncbi:hypothetical protein Nepgr_017059 [Nepenthes gracilis]|uniref:Uncharacterized protein n=1 Tax=Nepenthes gracilis TaxID=150966 RepID=A0AAD3SPS0_NEPGR|nr:hypothetical protein Nepgr_017059 [Nepenthes gracilis]
MMRRLVLLAVDWGIRSVVDARVWFGVFFSDAEFYLMERVDVELVSLPHVVMATVVSLFVDVAIQIGCVL